ncbi:MAG: hypothetical protein HYX38_05415 [Rhodospirillales bacterium]|nr:hypothetical protein [Rhodospirillales bacterium]
MKSALDCFQNAVRCEDMAHASYDRGQRQTLLTIAKTWRSLGETARERERQADQRRHWAAPKAT